MMNQTEGNRRPLDGIRVVDFGHYMAGPLTGMLLADQGADVVKVDRPGASDVESLARVVYDRGKTRVALDLKTTDGLATARELVDGADVVIENYRPGVMNRLGLGAEEMTGRHPGLVYLSLPGFASTDREKASIRAFEGVVGAATAQFTNLRPGGSEVPIYTPVPLGSTYGAVHGAIAVTLALYRRENTGRGDVIEVPLAGAAMSAMAVLLMRVADPPRRYTRGGPSPLYRSYQGGDGTWLFWIAGGHSRNTVQLVKTLGIYEDLIADGMVDLPVYEHLDLDHNLPDSNHLSATWVETLAARIETAVQRRPAAEWVRLMNQAGVPCALHRSTQDWLDAPETDAAGLTIVVEDDRFGPVRQLGLQAHLSQTPDFAPDPPDASPDAAAWSRRPAGPADTLASDRPMLDGLRVLDLSNVLAGPACARTLAEYGADVIKIDTPDPYFGPRVHHWFPIEVSPGKRSLILDLKSDRGREIFDRLVDTADVIVHNFRPGVADRLRIDYDRVHRRNPTLVYLNITALDGPTPGPWKDRPGFDPMVQAATGIQVRYGGAGKRPILHGWASCIDYLTGYSGAFGVALALLRAKLGGPPGAFVTTSLAQGAQLVQAPFMFSARGHPTGGEPQGQDAVGEHSLHRIYRARDGWLFLAGTVADLPRLATVAGLDGVPVAPDQEAERSRVLEQQIGQDSVDRWMSTFVEAGFGCHRIEDVEELRRNYLHPVSADLEGLWDDGRSISAIRMADHPAGSAVDLCPPAYARFRSAPLKLGRPAQALGAHSREILREIGFDDEEIDDVVTLGVVKERVNEAYLPNKSR
jgi:crotonobetainyl-CoA:carnitine CoA-transferase CaiB-like acyl-CoA transferase